MPARSALSGIPRYDRTTAAILDAAAHALAEHGSRANMADVAAAAGVSRATLYRYYRDREALLAALASSAVEQRVAAAVVAIQGGTADAGGGCDVGHVGTPAMLCERV